MRTSCSFTELPKAVIHLGSITELKRYLLQHRPIVRGLPVDRYDVRDGEVRARLVYPDGSKAWEFAGYLEDLAHNIQLGLYEGGSSGEPSGNSGRA